MSKWHYEYIDEIISKDIIGGKYFVYNRNTFNLLLHNQDWVHLNNANDEQDWILDNLDKMLESFNKESIYIPTFETSSKIDAYYQLKDLEEEPY